MFPNQNNPNGGDNRVNVNTNIKTFYSDSVSLNLSCWNDRLSFRWSTAIGKDGNGYTQYDKKHGISTALTYSLICGLQEVYNRKIKPVKDAGETPSAPIHAPIPLQNGNILFITYQTDENGVTSDYLNLYRKETNDTVSFRFDTVTSVVDFDPATGSGTVEESIPADFTAFMKILDNVVLMLPIVNHAKKLSAAYSQAFGNGNNQQAGSVNDFNAMNPPVDMGGGEFPFYS